MQMNEVKTVFVAVDEASGPLAQISRASDQVKASAEKAQEALQKAGPMAQGGGEGRGGLSPEEKEMFKEDREMMMVMRKRKVHMRVQMHEEHALHRNSAAMAALLIGEEKSFLGSLI